MVSLIYECFGEIFHGSFYARFLYLRKASEDLRSNIRTAVRLNIAFPFEDVIRIITSTLNSDPLGIT